MRALLDLIAPIRCLSCGAAADGELCADCADTVRVLTHPLCARCGSPTVVPSKRCPACRPLPSLGRARSLVAYAEPARTLTLALKRRGRRPVARGMGVLLGALALREGFEADVVTFVPAGRRARGPGFDHAELIARETAIDLGLPVKRLLVRCKDGPRQADVPFSQRRRNVMGRFAARSTDKRILVIDDVFTTGATAEACSRALLDAGARSVDVLTWARTLKHSQAAR